MMHVKVLQEDLLEELNHISNSFEMLERIVKAYNDGWFFDLKYKYLADILINHAKDMI